MSYDRHLYLPHLVDGFGPEALQKSGDDWDSFTWQANGVTWYAEITWTSGQIRTSIVGGAVVWFGHLESLAQYWPWLMNAGGRDE